MAHTLMGRGIALFVMGFTAGYNQAERENHQYLYCYNPDRNDWDRCRVGGEDGLYTLTGKADNVTIINPKDINSKNWGR